MDREKECPVFLDKIKDNLRRCKSFAFSVSFIKKAGLTVSDFVFLSVALIKFLPHLHIPIWLWIWIGIIAMIKFGNVAWGFVRTKKLISPHTVLNKITGLLLFLLPVTISFVDLTYTLPIVCTVATVAAIHEVYHTYSEKKL